MKLYEVVGARSDCETLDIPQELKSLFWMLCHVLYIFGVLLEEWCVFITDSKILNKYTCLLAGLPCSREFAITDWCF